MKIPIHTRQGKRTGHGHDDDILGAVKATGQKVHDTALVTAYKNTANKVAKDGNANLVKKGKT